MEYKIVKETHPTLKNYGKYKAVAMHYKTVTPEEIADEIERNCSAKKSDVDSQRWRPRAHPRIGTGQAGDRQREGCQSAGLPLHTTHPWGEAPSAAREQKGHAGTL